MVRDDEDVLHEGEGVEGGADGYDQVVLGHCRIDGHVCHGGLQDISLLLLGIVKDGFYLFTGGSR